ncbi:uncharacterized protein LOC105189479 isoform X3 [Harpegnathos saltator]|uniref:uncharacterized protein LOC105189479 isoform X3 n=1 Tax=Harpegnathos saltator TaxID=610380 RepID=UPI00058D59ED|nr:uncharacterized protein LOC105189479 isoform X3 [Harpegnathos saltator]
MQRYVSSCNTTADKQTDNVQHCTCCLIHKNIDEKLRRVFKELFLIREVTKERCEEIKLTVLQKGDLNNTDGNEPTFLSTFQFPLQNIEELKVVEQYLQEAKRFQSTVKELSKIGGTTPYDFVKRYLSLLLTNKFAEQYS